jgi:hypothetical protein
MNPAATRAHKGASFDNNNSDNSLAVIDSFWLAQAYRERAKLSI